MSVCPVIWSSPLWAHAQQVFVQTANQPFCSMLSVHEDMHMCLSCFSVLPSVVAWLSEWQAIRVAVAATDRSEWCSLHRRLLSGQADVFACGVFHTSRHYCRISCRHCAWGLCPCSFHSLHTVWFLMYPAWVSIWPLSHMAGMGRFRCQPAFTTLLCPVHAARRVAVNPAAFQGGLVVRACFYSVCGAGVLLHW